LDEHLPERTESVIQRFVTQLMGAPHGGLHETVSIGVVHGESLQSVKEL
jgi:hypothetical protein